MAFNHLGLKSVRFRTTAGASMALAVLVVLGAVLVNVVVSREIRAGLDQTLLLQANDRAALFEQGSPAEALTTTTGHEALVVLVDPNGVVVASSGAANPSDFATLAPGVSDQLVLLDHGEDGEAHPEQLRTAVVQQQDGSMVIVAIEAEAQEDIIKTVRVALSLGAIVMTAMAAAIAWTVTGRALRPVARMRSDLDGIVSGGQQTTTRRVALPGTADEIEGLAVGMNEVLQRLDEQHSVRKQFVSDASHELQSPIANAKILLETAGTESTHDLHDRVGAELNRLQSLVDDLLFLAKHDEEHGQGKEWGAVDLDDIVFDEAERLTIRSPHRVDASGVQPAQVFGDRGHLSRAVRNLMENASRHTASVVRVSIELGGSACEIHVDDDGPGVPEADRRLVFERFGRSSHARSRDGGTGLGLSIVSSIMSEHHGHVTVGDSPLGGARFTLSAPRSE